MRALFVALFCLASTPLAAMELARFQTQRPEPFEAGSAENAAVASSLVDGIVVPPGEVFSFNRSLTPGLSRFVVATAYSDGLVVKSDGGGVCQVTAALYNAALLSGMEVLERYNHSVYDPKAAYVAPGQDCAISRTNRADFRFRNNTAAPLTISARAEGGLVEVVFYGKHRKPKRRWIVTEEVGRRPHKVIERLDPKLAPGERVLKQKGFDGLRIARQLCKAGPEGVTQCASLGIDDYKLMSEIWRVGPTQPERGNP